MSKDDLEIVEIMTDFLEGKNGENIVVLDVKDITLVCNYFIIVNGKNPNHMQALSNGLVDKLKEEEDLKPLNNEGVKKGDWVLLDYGSVVVHVFSKEAREFYNLERLWGEAREVEVFEK